MLAQAQVAKTWQASQDPLPAETSKRQSGSGAQLRHESDLPQPATAEAEPAAAAQPQNMVVLDVRNDYEWDAGHFAGAHRPQEVRHALPQCAKPCPGVSSPCPYVARETWFACLQPPA